MKHVISTFVLALAFTTSAMADGNLISTCTFTLDDAPEGAINSKAVFTVNVADNVKVYFSQGNLQYQATDNGVAGHTTHTVQGGGTANGIFRFAEHQYDIIGNTQGNTSTGSTQTLWQDLFCWATSGGNSSYPPYKRATSSFSYKTIAGTNYEWGYYNAISNGGDTPGAWRCLTKKEWCCLLGFQTSYVTPRPDATSKRSKATVNTIQGVVILPDEWNKDAVSDIPWTSGASDFATNTYSLEQWDKMEQNGAVFLPVAGYRTTSSSSWSWTKAGYWSTDNYSTSSSSYYPFCVYFNSSAFSYYNYSSSSSSCYSYSVMSVRLVQDVQK